MCAIDPLINPFPLLHQTFQDRPRGAARCGQQLYDRYGQISVHWTLKIGFRLDPLRQGKVQKKQGTNPLRFTFCRVAQNLGGFCETAHWSTGPGSKSPLETADSWSQKTLSYVQVLSRF